MCLVRGNKRGPRANTAVHATTIPAAGRSEATAGSGSDSRNHDSDDADSESDRAAGNYANKPNYTTGNDPGPDASASSDDVACPVHRRRSYGTRS